MKYICKNRHSFFVITTILFLLLLGICGEAVMQDTVFREYDIRGKIGSEFDIDEIYDLSRAIAYYFVQENPSIKTVSVGMDGRLHSPAIKEQMCAALTDSGLDVLFIGMCTSPALYFSLHTLPVDAGLMITASHNPKEYNGIKMCLGKKSIWGVQIKEIGKLFKERRRVQKSKKGIIKEYPIVDSYVTWLADHFDHIRGMRLSVVIDCGNGAAGTVLPQLIKKMEWENVQLLYDEVDGTYPHHEADPIVEKNMADVKKILAETDREIGIGLDGDCDRMAPMTKNGYLVPGDRLLALFSREVLKQNPGAAIVFDVKTSSGLIELLESWGARACISATGHPIIKEQIEKQNAVLGGELSCHFCFKDRYFGYDDGIYALLRLFELLITSGKDLQELLTIFPAKISSPEIRIDCPLEKMPSIVNEVKETFANRADVHVLDIDGVRATMDYGWGLVRASNTQPVLSMRFESDSHDGLKQVKQDFFELLSPYFDDTLLKQEMDL